MKLKTLLIVIAVLAALSAAVWFLDRPEPPPTLADTRVGRPLLDPASAEKAARLRLVEGARTVDLARDADTGAWRVASNHDLPADFTKLAAFVKSLASARVERLVTTSPERIARLEFSDTRVELLDSAQKPLLSVSLGKLAETGGGRFLRFGDENKAYLARLDAWLDFDPSGWTDKSLARFAPADIAKVSVAFPAGEPLVVSRASASESFAADKTPDGKRLKADTINSLLSTLSSLRFTETTAADDPKAAGAREAARAVTLTTFDGKTIAFALGRQPERTVVKEDALKPAPKALLSGEPEPGPADLVGPVTEKLPAGPAFVFITHSDASNPVNALMQKRAFQIADYALTSLPAGANALFEDIPQPAKTAEKSEAPETNG